MSSRLMRAHNRCHAQARGYGYEPVAARVLGVVSHRIPYRCSALSQAGITALRFAVLLDLLLHVDAGHAVALFELVGHERVAFAFPHAGREREFEQQHPGFVNVHGQGRSALFFAPRLGTASISCFGWSGERILVSVGSTLGGLTRGTDPRG